MTFFFSGYKVGRHVPLSISHMQSVDDTLVLDEKSWGRYFFWIDRWVGDVPLCVKFCCLFKLAVTLKATITGMFALGLGECGEIWKWHTSYGMGEGFGRGV